MKTYDITGVVIFNDVVSEDFIERSEKALEERFPEAAIIVDESGEEALWLQLFIDCSSSPKHTLETFFRHHARQHGLTVKKYDLDIATSEELEKMGSVLLEAVFPHPNAQEVAPLLEAYLQEHYPEHEPYTGIEQAEGDLAIRVSLYAQNYLHPRKSHDYMSYLVEAIEDALEDIGQPVDHDNFWMQSYTTAVEDRELPFFISKEHFLAEGEEDIPVEEWTESLYYQRNSLAQSQSDVSALDSAHQIAEQCCFTAEEKSVPRLERDGDEVQCVWKSGMKLSVQPGGEKARLLLPDGNIQQFENVMREFMPFAFGKDLL